MQLSVKITVLYLVFSALVFSTLVFSARIGAAPAIAAPGKISGTVNYCDQGGILGMKISLSGRQASIYTADDGKFVFETVTAGRYALFFAIEEKLVHISNNIDVKADETTQLGEIAFCVAGPSDAAGRELEIITDSQCAPQSQVPECIDNDKDGVAAARDCDDNNEHVRPGAPEVCDGIDNNCNGKIDDLGTVWIENGEGICQHGAIVVKSCNRGFADCDAKPDNGCEIDIMNDNDHCGGCGNVCPSLEICVAGIC
jgi:hypothetical protein